MRFSIVTAWKDLGDPDRQRSFEWTRRYWAHHFPDAELVVATPDPFTRARGLNQGVRAATHELILQADPDTVVPVQQARDALWLASQSDRLVVPFSEYLYLNREATQRLHDAPFDDPPSFTEQDCQQYGVGGCGPITAYTRSTWEKAGGYDERFGIWGGDDSAFSFACDAYCNPGIRVQGQCWHSFHERLPQSIPGNPGYQEQFAILAAYRDAAAISKEAVKKIVESR